MARPTISKIIKARDLAAAGVDYSARFGAICPWCGKKTKIIRTMPWDDTLRIRYHRCQGKGCVLANLGTTIKSVEVDLVEMPCVVGDRV
jgi:hypothetical protein